MEGFSFKRLAKETFRMYNGKNSPREVAYDTQ